MRYAAGIEYDGTGFQGWQRLTGSGDCAGPPTLQASLERALASVADRQVDTVCAGRTDAGVHARCQVVHFDSNADRDPRAWVLGTTTRLPPSMCLRWCTVATPDFHARFSARARCYRYRLVNRAVRPALDRHLLAWERRPLDVTAMHEAAQHLLGEHDFSAFRTVHCQAPHACRDLQAISVARDGEEVHIEVRANAFLHHMVRNIVGSLLLVGRGQHPPGWIADVLRSRDRRLAGPTAAARGLCFIGPLYPVGCGLPAEVTMESTDSATPPPREGLGLSTAGKPRPG